jgi:hypothetical protein
VNPPTLQTALDELIIGEEVAVDRMEEVAVASMFEKLEVDEVDVEPRESSIELDAVAFNISERVSDAIEVAFTIAERVSDAIEVAFSSGSDVSIRILLNNATCVIRSKGFRNSQFTQIEREGAASYHLTVDRSPAVIIGTSIYLT